MKAVYRILLSADGRSYIGSSGDLVYRWGRHKRDLNAKAHHSRHLQRAWDKYGAEAFTWEILEALDDSATSGDLIQAEQKWIDAEHPAFNSRPVANSNLGVKLSDETKAKMSAARIGNKSNTGRTLTPEHRANIAAGSSNKKKTHCIKGHPFDAKNTYITKTGSRSCRTCQRDYQRAYRATPEGHQAVMASMRKSAAKRRQENPPVPVPRKPRPARTPKTHCMRGHEMNEENTYRWNGERACLACRRYRSKINNAKMAERRRLAKEAEDAGSAPLGLAA